jgi:hypothetical protein
MSTTQTFTAAELTMQARRLALYVSPYSNGYDRLAAMLRQAARDREALEWLVHLANGVGKSGDGPESGEWEAAWQTAGRALDGTA